MTPAQRSYAPTDSQVPARISNSTEYAAPSPEDYAMASREPPHAVSLTELAAESMRTGIAPHDMQAEVPGDDALLCAGDPDVDPLTNEFSGDEMPGGSNPAPDQNDVDAIGRAYGLSEQDGAILRSAEEILDKRDARPWNAESKDPS